MIDVPPQMGKCLLDEQSKNPFHTVVYTQLVPQSILKYNRSMIMNKTLTYLYIALDDLVLKLT